jgi:hypothetical protein
MSEFDETTIRVSTDEAYKTLEEWWGYHKLSKPVSQLGVARCTLAAIECGHTVLFSELIKSHVKSPVFIARILYEILQRGNDDYFTQLTDIHPGVFITNKQCVPMAISSGNIELVKHCMRLKFEFDVNELCIWSNLSPIMCAVASRNPEMVKYIMQHEIFHHGPSNFELSLKYSLRAALKIGEMEISKILLLYVNIQHDIDKLELLSTVIYNHQCEGLELLLTLFKYTTEQLNLYVPDVSESEFALFIKHAPDLRLILPK